MRRRAGWRSFSSEPREVGEPDLDERPHGFLEPGCARDLECLLEALARLGGVDALLQPVVAGHEQLLDTRARLLALHRQRLTRHILQMEAAAAPRPTIKVLIADDQEMFIRALEAILATDERIEVAGHALDGKQAVELALRLSPDVVLMDISMPVMDGFEATRLIRASRANACVLMLTGSSSSSDVDGARRAGAAAYVTKDRIGDELIAAIFELASR